MELYSKEELLKELKKEYSCGGECDHCPEVLDAGSCAVLRCIRRIIDKAQPVKFSLMPADESKDEAYMRGYEKGKVEGILRNNARPQGECRTCKHRDPEDKKCDCGALERQGCPFPVSDHYYCKYYEKGGAENG